MEITVEQKDRYTLVTLRGRIVSGEAPAVSAKLRAEMAQLHYRFVIDMANATFVSATFLRLIIAVNKECRRFNHGRIRLANVSPKIREVFELAGIMEYIDVHNTLEEAIAAFGGQLPPRVLNLRSGDSVANLAAEIIAMVDESAGKPNFRIVVNLRDFKRALGREALVAFSATARRCRNNGGDIYLVTTRKQRLSYQRLRLNLKFFKSVEEAQAAFASRKVG